MSINPIKKSEAEGFVVSCRPDSDIAGDHYDDYPLEDLHHWECECGITRRYYVDSVQCQGCGCLGISPNISFVL